MKRPQKLEDGTWVSQMRDPYNPKRRLQVRGASEGEVIARCEAIRREKRDAALGLGDPNARLQIVKALGEARLTVERVWNEYRDRQSFEQQRVLKSTWNNMFAKVFGAELLVIELDADRMLKWERHAAARHTVRGTLVRRTTIEHSFHMLRAAVNYYVPSRMPALPWGTWKPTGLGAEPGGQREILMSTDEVLALLLAARQHDDRERKRGMFSNLEHLCAIAFLCGLRQGELCGLGWDDISLTPDLQSGIMSIRHQVKPRWAQLYPHWTRPLSAPKGRNGKRVQDPPQALHPDAIMYLLDQQAQVERRGWFRKDGPVFPHPRSGEWRRKPEAIKPETMRDLCRQIGMPEERVQKFVTHSSRHTFATLEGAAITAAGGNWRDLKERTRHRDPSILQGYIHRLTPGAGLVQPAMARLGVPSPEIRLLPEKSTFEKREAARTPAGLLAPPRRELTARDVAEAEVEEIAAEQERFTSARVKRKRGEGRGLDWARLAREWVNAGERVDKRPRCVTEDLNVTYSESYNTAKRSGATDSEAKATATRSRRAAASRWNQIIKRLTQPSTLRRRSASERRDSESETGGNQACG